MVVEQSRGNCDRIEAQGQLVLMKSDLFVGEHGDGMARICCEY